MSNATNSDATRTAQALVTECRALDSNVDLDGITHDIDALTEIRDYLVNECEEEATGGHSECGECGARVYPDGNRECDSRCPRVDGRPCS